MTFLGYGGIILKRQIVDYGGAAEAPSAPQIAGMAFVGWDRDFSFVTSDITVNAIYAESTSSHALPGDVNGDGEVSFADISILYDYLIGGYELPAPYVQNADHNGDGTVDFSDIASIYAACLFA